MGRCCRVELGMKERKGVERERKGEKKYSVSILLVHLKAIRGKNRRGMYGNYSISPEITLVSLPLYHSITNKFQHYVRAFN